MKGVGWWLFSSMGGCGLRRGRWVGGWGECTVLRVLSYNAMSHSRWLPLAVECIFSRLNRVVINPPIKPLLFRRVNHFATRASVTWTFYTLDRNQDLPQVYFSTSTRTRDEKLKLLLLLFIIIEFIYLRYNFLLTIYFLSLSVNLRESFWILLHS